MFEKLAHIGFKHLNTEMLERLYLEQFNERDRKNLGQIYTPYYIIRFILHHIDLLTELKNIQNDFQFKILDPACGLGRFLLETYEFLKKKLRDHHWNEEKSHRILLTRVLYGIDLEPLAAELTALALVLKNHEQPVNYLPIAPFNILESEPEAKKNLQLINIQKLIAGDSSDSTEIAEKEFALNNFDVVIGNPPYFLMSQKADSPLKGKQFHKTYFPKNALDFYRTHYESWPFKNRDPNIFYLFIECGIQLLRDGGYLGYIIPDILLAGKTTENLRKYILATCRIKKIMVIKGKVFEQRGISNIILILQKCNDAAVREKSVIEVITTSTSELIKKDGQGIYDNFDEAPHSISQRIFYATPQNNFAIRMREENSPLFENILNKIKTGNLIKLSEIIEVQRGIENLKKRDTLNSTDSPQKTYRKLIATGNIEKYRINWDNPKFPNKMIDYDPQNRAYSHIDFKKPDWFIQPKIVLKRVSNKLIAALDTAHKTDSEYFFTMDSVQMIWLKEKFKDKCDLRVILAILNSEFMNFYYQTLFSYKQLFSRVQKAFLLELPIPSAIPSKISNEICELVNRMMEVYEEKIEVRINQLITDLYFTSEGDFGIRSM